MSDDKRWTDSERVLFERAAFIAGATMRQRAAADPTVRWLGLTSEAEAKYPQEVGK